MAVALITGASSGIGRALARLFAQDTYGLVLVADDPVGLKSAADEMKSLGALFATPFVYNLAQSGNPQQLYDDLYAKGLDVEILVNNAGEGQAGSFADIPLEQHLELIRLDIEAVTVLTRLFLPPMLTRGSGRILNVGSIAGFTPGPLMSVYHASKAYVVSLSQAIAEEIRDTQVTITCLCPGPTETHFFATAGLSDSRMMEHKNAVMMTADEVAEAGYHGLMHGERLVVPGARNKAAVFSSRVLPQGLTAKAQRKAYEHA